MATTYYHTLNGRIRGETTSGVRTNYLTDALGSVTATANSSGSVVNTYRYKPYGALLAKTGVSVDPRFGWTGETGSRRTATPYSEQFNSHRHYATTLAAWTSRDRLFPSQAAWQYALNNPASLIDPSGLSPAPSCCCCPIAIVFVAEKCYGPGSGRTPVCWFDSVLLRDLGNRAKDFRGHNLVVNIAWDETPTNRPPEEACRLSFWETAFVNGDLVRDREEIIIDGVPSLQLMQFRACKSLSRESCAETVICSILDSPGVLPYGKSGKREPFDWKLSIKVTLYPHPDCQCNSISKTWDQHILWKKSSGEPDVWTP